MVDAAWSALATEQKRVVLAVGYTPMGPGDHPFTYVEQESLRGRVVLGVLPAVAG